MSTIAALMGIAHITRKRESPLEPFKRTAQLADEEQEKAFTELECALQELKRVVEEKSK